MADLLLVDNDARIVELLAWFLRRCGHEVRTADSYRAAREQVLQSVPDLMLADLELTRERGEEELPRLAAEGLLPPTLVVSGYLDSTLEQQLLAIEGVLGTLAKPFDLDLLRQRIEASLALAAPPIVATRAAAAGATAGTTIEVEPAAPGWAVAAERPAGEEDEDGEGWIEIVPGPSAGPTEPLGPAGG